MTQRTVLIVDDDEEILSLMQDFLEADGFHVRTAKNGRETRSVLANTEVNLIVLDIMLPEESGFEVCRQIRQNFDGLLIFLSARQEDHDKIRGLGLGADDYIVKSTTPSVIVAKIRAMLRRSERSHSRLAGPCCMPALGFEGLKIIPETREVWVRTKVVYLTAKEFDLLYFLASNPKRVFTTDELFQRIWGNDGEDPHTLRVHIARIRSKIDDHSAKWIHTVWGIGYKFVCQ